jgi:hypothetical protein
MTAKTQPNPVDGCPVCGNALWDNRETKKNPKAPDYKCRDKTCEGVIWPLKPGETYAPPKNGAPAPTPGVDFKKLNQQKQAYSSGPALPYEQETGAPPHVESGSVHQKLDKMFSVYDVCLDHAHAVAKRQFGNDVTDTAVAAMTATLFIAAKEGLR